jgi:hypothetical protein
MLPIFVDILVILLLICRMLYLTHLQIQSVIYLPCLFYRSYPYWIQYYVKTWKHNGTPLNLISLWCNNNNNHGSTALYGLGPPRSEVTGSCAFGAVGDWPTGRAAVLSILMWPPEPSGRQSGDLKGGFEFSLRNISIHARKVLLHAVNLRHGTDGFTSPPKEVVLRIFIGRDRTREPWVQWWAR